ncbi:hypothetical protein B0O80DRAFT_503051 [Mortierella sp. GBAus27b]|nr:hypothetical protein B0O80DRAFT_503051 [Mortierella sp. GBAus27b]
MILSLKSICVLTTYASFLLTMIPPKSSLSRQKGDRIPKNRGPFGNSGHRLPIVIIALLTVEAGLYLYLMGYRSAVRGRPATGQLLPQTIAQLGTLETWHVVAVSASIVGAALRYWSFLALDQLFTFQMVIRPQHTLIGSGPYTYIRHPSYIGALLCAWPTLLMFHHQGLWDVLVAYLAQSRFYPLKALANQDALLGVSGGNWIALVVLSLFLRVVIIRIGLEEAMLKDHFGKEWDEYASKRWRLIPFLY